MKKIVCTAVQSKKTYDIILGIRHFDRRMHAHIGYINKITPHHDREDFIQGFIDNKGNFLDRKEAYKVAKEAGQIINKIGGKDSEDLYSEDIY